MTATAEPITVLDPDVVEELTPPCEIRYLAATGYVIAECTKPAEWVVSGSLDCGGGFTYLACPRCKDAVVRFSAKRGIRCATCRDSTNATITRLERL